MVLDDIVNPLEGQEECCDLYVSNARAQEIIPQFGNSSLRTVMYTVMTAKPMNANV